MRNLWCKLWNTFLELFTDVVNGVGYALATVGEVIVDVFGQVADAVGNALGIDGSTVLWLGLGLGAYFLFSGGGSDERRENRRSREAATSDGRTTVRT